MGLFIKEVFGVLLLSVTTKTDACRQLAFNAPITDKILVGHVINTAKVIDERYCRVLCYMEADCKSFNMAGVNSEGKATCELNNSDDIQHPNDLISFPEIGFSYHGTKNKCSGISSPAHRKCQNGFTNAGFQIVCSEMGKNYGQVFGWTKINTDPVCFGARDDSFGNFIIKTAGEVLSFKLLYVNGNVSCTRQSGYQSRWGCYAYVRPHLFDTHITYPNRTRILPAERFLSRSRDCYNYLSYILQGFNIDSNEIIFNNFSRPISVCPGDQFQIWYGQDLSDCSETNNGGQTCTDVYGLYV